VTSEFWHASSKYAYHTKIEVTVPTICTPAEAQAVISDFIRASVASIEECLPPTENEEAPGKAGENAGGAGTHQQETR
jgi:hypothetical protein